MARPRLFPSRRRPHLMYDFRHTPFRGLLIALGLSALCPAFARAAITCASPKVELRDAFEGRQLLVSENGRDVTREAKYSSANAKVAMVDEKGYVSATGDGTTNILIQHGNDKLEVSVTV